MRPHVLLYHLFQPLLYQVATASLSPADIAQPIRHVLRRYRNVRVLLVELAGALAEIGRKTLAAEYRHVDPRDTRVLLVERAPRLLPTFPEQLSASTEKQLEALGVEVRNNTAVARVESGVVVLSPDETDRAGRVPIAPDLSVPGHLNVFVVGDLAAVPNTPGVAPAAMQMGTHAARNVLEMVDSRPTRPFKYWNKGNLARVPACGCGRWRTA